MKVIRQGLRQGLTFQQIIERLKGYRSTLQLAKHAFFEDIPPCKSTFIRKLALLHHQADDCPGPVNVTKHTDLLWYGIQVLAAVQRAGSTPYCTTALLAASFQPYLKPGGHSARAFGLSPFMVWEERQHYRLFTSAFVHSNLAHLRKSSQAAFASAALPQDLQCSANTTKLKLQKQFVGNTANMALKQSKFFRGQCHLPGC